MRTPLRWLTVVLPVLLIAVVEALYDRILDPILPPPVDVLVVPAVVLVFAVVFAAFTYRRMDRLADAMRTRTAALERSNASLTALRRVGMSLTALVEIDTILSAVVEEARALLDADVAFIALGRPDGTHRLAAFAGDRATIVQGAHSGDDPRDLVDAAQLSAQVAAPLRRGDVTVGTLVAGRARPAPFSGEDFETLTSLASQAAIAIEKERLQRELRELAIRGERERIAREMHDGLAQVLGYVNTKAQAAAELLAGGQTDGARQQLEELSAAARSVFVDVREAILGLSSPIAPERGLVGALEEYALRFSDASKLATHVSATDSAARLELAPEIQAQVFRVVQEALTNVRKHASAHRAGIALDVREDRLVVEVTDDGKGFDPDRSPADGWPRYGMRVIRERAASIGADVEWSPTDGAGTVLRLTLPQHTPALSTP